jgi:hypothetical protein
VIALGARGAALAVVPGDGRGDSVIQRLRSASPTPERVATGDGAERSIGRLGVIDAAAAAFGGQFLSVGPFTAAPAP